MSRNLKRQLRDQFIDFTHTTSAIAEQFLKSTNYDLELAINEYLSYQASPSHKDNKKLSAIFDSYKEPNSDIIGIDGTIKYIEDLGYEPEDKVALALAEFLESPSAGVFNRQNFMLKWQSTHIETLDDMKKHVQYLETQLNTNVDYLRRIYEFTFTFSLDEGQRTLRKFLNFEHLTRDYTNIYKALETANEYWRLLLRPIYGDKIESWITFLNQKWKQAISKDTWNMFFIFLQDYEKDPELATYDETAAWPSIIDDFVDFIKEGSGR